MAKGDSFLFILILLLTRYKTQNRSKIMALTLREPKQDEMHGCCWSKFNFQQQVGCMLYARYTLSTI